MPSKFSDDVGYPVFCRDVSAAKCQALGRHPDRKEVIPLAPEPIINEDGHTKNDCERNATRRWLLTWPPQPQDLVKRQLSDTHAVRAVP